MAVWRGFGLTPTSVQTFCIDMLNANKEDLREDFGEQTSKLDIQ